MIGATGFSRIDVDGTRAANAISELSGDIVTSGSAVSTIQTGVVNTSKMGGDVTAAGKALLTANDNGAQRTALGLAAIAASGSASDLGTGTLPIARIADADVTLAKIQNLTQGLVLGRASGAGTGVATQLTGAQVKTILAIAAGDVSGLAAVATSGSAADLSTGSLPAARIPNSLITLAMMADVSTARLIGRTTAGTGAPEVLSVLPTATMPALTGDVTNPAGSLATTIANGAVSLAKLANMATSRIRGRATAGSGAPEELTGTQVTAMLDTRTETLPGLMPANMGRKTSLAANLSIANTLTQVVGFTAAVNTLKVGTTIRFRGLGLLTNTTGASTSILTARINSASLGSTIEASWSQVLGIVARTNSPFIVEGEIIVISTGAGGTAWGVIVVTVDTTTALASPTSMVTAAVTCITTQSNVVELTCISGAASTTWNFISATIEVVQP